MALIAVRAGELLEGYGFEPHLVHPLRCKAIVYATFPLVSDVRVNASYRVRSLIDIACRAPTLMTICAGSGHGHH